jgi:hypothetical protein
MPAEAQQRGAHAIESSIEIRSVQIHDRHGQVIVVMELRFG